MRIEHHGPRRRDRARGLLKFVILNVAIGSLLVAGLVVYFSLSSSTASDLGSGATDLNPVEKIVLNSYLNLNASALHASPGVDPSPVKFVVGAGENADTVSRRLSDAGLVSDSELLRLYMRYKGLDNNIEAGNFMLNKTMTIPQVAQALTNASPDEIRWRAWEGWRLEQISESLSGQPNLDFDPQEFLRLVGPNGHVTGSYSFVGSLPAGASLEGFLFPDTYRLGFHANTATIVDRLLSQFDARVTAQMRADATTRGLSLYQVITLASIVEREGVHDDERPTIASVYLNRLAANMNLDADPTTQYAIATSANWWPPLDLDPRTVNHPYNTYVIPGLPPGPIANPGLASIQAVIYPAQTGYYYFRARCDGSHYHNFATTYEEHVANGCP